MQHAEQGHQQMGERREKKWKIKLFKLRKNEWRVRENSRKFVVNLIDVLK